MTRTEWINSCADHYTKVGGVSREISLDFAEAGAEEQTETHGENTANWDYPSDAADEDMTYWGE